MTKVLIADDSMMMRSILKSFILKAEIEVEFSEAISGDEAAEKYASFHPDIVFMDINMPGSINGLGATGRIIDLDPDAKVIMCTSETELFKVEDANRIGVKAYIRKPFNSLQVIDTVKKYA